MFLLWLREKGAIFNRKVYEMVIYSVKMVYKRLTGCRLFTGPYFSEGFARLVLFDWTAAILVCKTERNLGRLSKLPREAVVKVHWVEEEERETWGGAPPYKLFLSTHPTPPNPARLDQQNRIE